MAVPKLRFKAEDGSEFPEWEKKSLRELCDAITDGSHFSPASVDEGYYMPSVKDMNERGFDFSSCKKISKTDYELLRKQGCQPQIGDVLLVKDGAAVLSRVFSVVDEPNYVILSSIAIIRPNRRLINSEFLVQCFKVPSFVDRVIKENKTGSGIPRIVLKNFEKLVISFPSINEQKKIADFLSTIDSIISSQKEELAAWEQRKKGVMQKLFCQEVRFKAEDGREFPEWEEKRLKDICCKIGSGKTPKGGQEIYQDCGVMLIRSQNVRNGFLDLTDVAYISNEVNQTMLGSTLKFNDLLLNITGASIGRCCKYNKTQQGNVNQHVCVLRIENQEDTLPDFVLSYLLSNLIQNQIDLKQSGGSREGLNFQQVGNLKIKLPSLPEQKKIADCLSSIDEVIKKEKEELEKWQELKKGLLQQMFV